MDISWISNFIKENGIVGSLLLLFVLDKLKLLDKFRAWNKKKDDEIPHRRKDDGQIIHYHKRAEEQEKLLREWIEKMERHLEKQREVAVMISELKSDQTHLKEKMADLKNSFEKLEENQRDCFKLISDVKNTMISMLSQGKGRA